jgi:hypothetical protein
MVKFGTCKPKQVYGSNGGVFIADVWVVNDART